MFHLFLIQPVNIDGSLLHTYKIIYIFYLEISYSDNQIQQSISLGDDGHIAESYGPVPALFRSKLGQKQAREHGTKIEQKLNSQKGLYGKSENLCESDM